MGQLAAEDGVRLQQSMRHWFSPNSVMPSARGDKGTFNLIPLYMKAVCLEICKSGICRINHFDMLLATRVTHVAGRLFFTTANTKLHRYSCVFN